MRVCVCVCWCACVCTSGSSCRTVSYCLCIDDVAWFRNLGCGFCSNIEIKFQPRPVHLEVPEMNRDTVQKEGSWDGGKREDGQGKRELDITSFCDIRYKYTLYVFNILAQLWLSFLKVGMTEIPDKDLFHSRGENKHIHITSQQDKENQKTSPDIIIKYILFKV